MFDASTSDAGAAGPIVASPMPPVLTPCPPGWTEREIVVGVTGCEPWPETDVDPCGETEARIPGEPGCVSVGPACPTDGPFPADVVADGPVAYVLAGAIGGDGSRERPYGTIVDAQRSVSSGTTLVVGPGTYAEYVRPRWAQLSIRGACAERTVLTVGDPAIAELFRGVIDIEGAKHLDLSGVTIDGARTKPGIWIDDGASVQGRGIVIRNAADYGIMVNDGSRLDVETFRVTGVRPGEQAAGGVGIVAFRGSTLRVSRGTLWDNRNAAIYLNGSSEAEIADSLLAGTLSATAGLAGTGVRCHTGCEVRIVRSVFRDNALAGIGTDRGNGTLWVEDSLLEDNFNGIYAPAQVLTVTRTVVRRHPGLGIGGRDAPVVVRDVVLVNNAFSGDHAGPVGLVVIGAPASIERVHIERTGSMGATMVDSSLDLTDLHIVDSSSSVVSGLFGGGLQLGTLETTAAQTRASRVRVRGAQGTGVRVSTGVRLDATDLAVETVGGETCSLGGTCPDRLAAHGIVVTDGATVSLSRFELLDAARCGLFLAEGASVDLSHGTVAGNGIGACVQSEGYDLSRLMDDVRYDNEANLQATSLPVPPPASVDL